MAIVVRRATESDLPALRENAPNPALMLVDQHFAEQSQGVLIYAVAEDAGQLLGSALLDFTPDEFTPELRNMYVFPNARRLGAGRSLSRWIEQQAREAGYSAVYLAVDPNNEKAVPLYVSLEYLPTGEHIFVAQPEVPQVARGQQPSRHYAVYKKSLTAL